MRGLSRFAWAVIVVAIIVVVVAAVVAITYKPSTSSVQAAKAPLIFYTWWATEGKVALNHLIPAFENQYHLNVTPTIVPGAGGTNAKYAILTLIEAGKPPALFQVHYGPEMISYVEIAPKGVNNFVNMTPIAQQIGLFKYAVPEVLQAGAFNGTLLSIPVNVHRGALLYINLKLLKKYNLPIPTNLSTLEYDTVQLAAHGVSPWMVPGSDGGWDQLNLWEDIFLSLAGPHVYNEMIYGVIPLNNATIQNWIAETNNLFLNFTSYDYPGWQSLTWTQGLTDLAQGNVAFQANGNWLTNYAYDFLNITIYPAVAPYINWNNVTIVEEPFPGTQNYYALVIDSVAVPVGPQEQDALTFIKWWASMAGQEIWTKWKAVTFYNNVTTDYFNTPAQWYDYKQLLSTPEQNFVYQLSDGGLFDDVFAQLNSGLYTLQQVGSSGIAAWNITLATEMHQEESEWLAAAKLGLGYLGFPGHPFAGYYPPWVNS